MADNKPPPSVDAPLTTRLARLRTGSILAEAGWPPVKTIVR